MTTRDIPEAIAVVGMAGRFPGAPDLEALWRNLRGGVDGITTFTDAEMLAAGAPPALVANPRYVKRGPVLEGIDLFDASFFGFSAREAELMDPQHRIFMECAWEALEDAACDPARFGGAIGVFAGSAISNYLLFNLISDIDHTGSAANMIAMIGNDKDYLASHVAYKLGLTGPSVSVQTACSTSLVAVHLACQSLQNGECDLALTGGVSVRVPQRIGYLYEPGGPLSADGRCRSFDASASGAVFGSGCGVVVLRRLRDAIGAGDRIRALILGSAVNNDGSRKVGFTAPSVSGEAAVIVEAQAVAEVTPDSITYVEAHGTGTPLGDPIEITALTEVFRRGTDAKGTCAVGSVKTNLGHLEAAAGVAGLIKVVLSMERGELPPSLHFSAPNPSIDFANSPFYVNTHLRPWPGKRRAGVSSFGIGGTNAHVVLEAAPPPPVRTTEAERPVHLLCLSARSDAALKDIAGRYEEHLRTTTDLFADVCYTANVGRAPFPYRLAIVAADAEEARARLGAFRGGREAPGLVHGQAGEGAPRVALLFTGQGSQHVGMGRALYEVEPTFRATIDRCEAALRGRLDHPLRAVLHDGAADLDEPMYAQPAIFAIETAFAELWRSWGVEPAAVMGHSTGEYAAACAGGVFSVEDGIQLIAERARLMQRLPPGGLMMAVFADEVLVSAALAGDRDVEVAAINGPANTVISGPQGAILRCAARLEAQGIKSQRLVISPAGHSELIEPMLDGLQRAAAQVAHTPVRLPVISNLTGREQAAFDASYWRRHARHTVRFASGVRRLLALGCDCFIEVGPHPVLTGLARQLPEAASVRAWIPSMRRNADAWRTSLEGVAQIFVLGGGIDLAALDRGRARRKVALPTYPFQRRRYWIEPRKDARRRSSTDHPLLGARLRTPLAPLLYESRLGAASPDYLGEHRVHGLAVFPGAGYLEMALAAGFDRVDDLTIGAAMRLPERDEDELVVQFVLDEAGTFRIFSAEGAAFRLHAQGRIGAGGGALGRVALDEVRARCAEVIEGGDYYARLRASGVEYGPRFMALARLHRREGEALAELQFDERIERDVNYRVHPIVLDACFQALGAALPASDDDGSFLPIALDSLRLRGPLGARSWVHAVLRPESCASAEIVTGDLKLVDESGRVVIEALGLHAKRARPEALQRRAAIDEHLYEIAWRPAPPVAARVEARPLDDSARPPGTVAIVADRGGIAGALDARLRSDGHRVIVREPGEALPCEPLSGVVHLSSLDATTVPDATIASLRADRSRDVGGVLGLLRDLAALPAPPRLLLATRGAQRVRPHESPAIAQAPLWGLARAIGLEHPELQCRAVDLDPLADQASQVEALAAEIAATDDEPAVARRGDERFVLRLARAAEPAGRLAVPRGRFRLERPRVGGIGDLAFAPASRTPPGAGQIEIEVVATGLNFKDVLNAMGMAAGAGPLGGECAGRVVAVGAGVTAVCVGDEVVAAAGGSFASHVTVPVALVVARPAGMSFEQAAAIPIAFVTAWFALRHVARLGPGQRALIHAATGGVGLVALQIAERAGAEIFATAGTPEKRSFLRARGVRHVFDSRSTAFAAEVLAATSGQGVDVVLNSLAGELVDAGLDALRPGGIFLEIGRGGTRTPEDVARLHPGVRYVPIGIDEVTAEVFGGLLREVMDALREGALKLPPIRVFSIEDTATALRWMQEAQHIGKIVVTQRGRGALVRQDATYVITGGLGGLGLATAEWLVAQGARHLALLGRSAPRPEARAAIARATAAGAEVLVLEADVSREEDLQSALDRVRAALPPVRGVIHAAGVLADAPLRDQDLPRFASVFGPKADGAWHLRRLAADLDFLVLYASAAGVLGSHGQGNHAAANAVLDALAHLLRAEGLPATSIDWAAWSEIGGAARLLADERARRAGISAIAPAEGLAALERILRGARAQVVVLPIDWALLRARYAGAPMPPIFAELAAARPAAGDAPAAPDFLEQLRRAPAERREEIVFTRVEQEVVRLLGIGSSEELDPRRPLRELGLDSLMAVELRNRLSALVSSTLPATLLFNRATLQALVSYLATEVLAIHAPDVPKEVPERAEIEEVQRMSEAELDGILEGFARLHGASE